MYDSPPSLPDVLEQFKIFTPVGGTYRPDDNFYWVKTVHADNPQKKGVSFAFSKDNLKGLKAQLERNKRFYKEIPESHEALLKLCTEALQQIRDHSPTRDTVSFGRSGAVLSSTQP